MELLLALPQTFIVAVGVRKDAKALLQVQLPQLRGIEGADHDISARLLQAVNLLAQHRPILCQWHAVAMAAPLLPPATALPWQRQQAATQEGSAWQQTSRDTFPGCSK